MKIRPICLLHVRAELVYVKNTSNQSLFNRQHSLLSPMLDTVKEIAYQHFKGARGSHNWDHTLRVCRLCEHLGSVEGVDLDVLLVAAYLHDIARGRQDDSNGAVCHAEEGARMAAPIVAELALTRNQKENILHCIRTHRFRGDRQPQTPEARVLFDADKLDAIGAVGVARAFLFAGELGARLHNAGTNLDETLPYSREDTGYREFKLKLCKIKDRMQTGEGLKLARGRHAFMEEFFKRFIDENEGKR
jgi:uncharacterized protein